MAFILKNLAEKYLKNEELGFNKNQGIEYFYAFDIHLNSFVPFYFFAIALQIFIIPLVISNSHLGTFISNALFFTGIFYYSYVTLMGYYCK